jgi:predicted outer membrane protein
MKKKAFSVSLSLTAIFCSFLFSQQALAQKKAMKLTDAEIASVAVTANQIDINAAELAKS